MYALAKRVADKRVKSVELLTAALPNGFLQKLQKRRPKCRPLKKENVLAKRNDSDNQQVSQDE